MYGLTVRTRTAAINASILPKMLETAISTQKSVIDTGIAAPLMIMRGDGGVMEIEEMKKRPVLTMLSGPAASVVGALMYLRASNGIYFEVGGTSTNIGVIKDGRPTVNYSVVGGHRTYISSLDVRVLGVAGGSLIRSSNKGIVDVGPRSAHIAGLPYAAFTPLDEIEDPQLEFFKPKPDDPDNYVRIRLKNGKCIALTNTCASNVLGLAKEEYFAHGNYDSCARAMKPLADYLGISIEDTARQILQKSCDKITDVINDLAFTYKLETDQSVLVGCGGGAAALIPFTSQIMGLKYSIPQNAEVISSIGVALAMVRDVVERVIPNPTTRDITEIKHEAEMMAINSGAVPDSIEVHIEIDAQTQKVTAIALGSTEVQTTDLLRECAIDEAKALAASSLSIDAGKIKTEASNGHIHIFSYYDGKCNQIRIVDKKGFIKIQRRNGQVKQATTSNSKEEIKSLWESCTIYESDTLLMPDIFVVIDSRILEFSGMQHLDQVYAIYETELAMVTNDKAVIIVGAKNDF
jgi:N-methylhydantoinase A/oxoprolinase/acetone carboxylase beta subunit